jgi:hypothetical protein
MRTSTTPTEIASPLTLSEQLDAMLSGWLERHAAGHEPGAADATAKAVVTVNPRAVREVCAFCERWDMTAERVDGSDWRRTVLIIEGRALPVRGFTEIAMLTR